MVTKCKNLLEQITVSDSKLLDINLAVAGYQAVCAMDGSQALEAIAAQSFDLTLLDTMTHVSFLLYTQCISPIWFGN